MRSKAAGAGLSVHSAAFMHVVLSTSCMPRRARVCAAGDALWFQTYHTIEIYVNMRSRAAGAGLPAHSAVFMHVVLSASCTSRRARVCAAVDALRFQTYCTIKIHINMHCRAAGMGLPVHSAIFMHVVLSASCTLRRARVCVAVVALWFQTYHTIEIYVNMLSRAAGMGLPVHSAAFMHVVLSASCTSRRARVLRAKYSHLVSNSLIN